MCLCTNHLLRQSTSLYATLAARAISFVNNLLTYHTYMVVLQDSSHVSLSKRAAHAFIPFCTISLNREPPHPREPLTPFHFTGKSHVCHVFPFAFICMHRVFPNILSSYATLARR